MKKSLSIAFILSTLAIVSISIISCASPSGENAETSLPYVFEGVPQAGVQNAPPSGENAETSLPYVFEGVAQAGVQNAPPVEVILDTELPTVPDNVPVYRVEDVNEEYISNLAHRLGFNNKPSQPADPNGPYTYIQGRDYVPGTKSPPGTPVIEFYKDGSLRLFNDEIRIQDVPKSLPSFEEAVEIATDWLVSYDLYPANVIKVEKGGGLEVGSAKTEVSTRYSLIVNFKTQLGDYEMNAPTASVEIGENGKIIKVWVNMTQVKEYGAVTLKTSNSALNILKARLTSPLANPPEARESLINLRNFERLTVTRVTLQYTSGGGFLQPVYVFEGSAYSQHNPNLDAFRGKVDAVAR